MHMIKELYVPLVSLHISDNDFHLFYDCRRLAELTVIAMTKTVVMEAVHWDFHWQVLVFWFLPFLWWISIFKILENFTVFTNDKIWIKFVQFLIFLILADICQLQIWINLGSIAYKGWRRKLFKCPQCNAECSRIPKRHWSCFTHVWSSWHHIP